MKDFKRGAHSTGSGQGFNDRGSRGGFGGNRPSRYGKPSQDARFNNKPRFSDRGGRNDGPKEMFSAKCSGCGRSCEVPFRPNGEKPVFCNDCFSAQKESQSGNFAPKPRFDKPRFDKPRFDRNDRPQRDFAPTVRPVAPVVDERNNRRIDELKAQVAGLSAQMKEVLAIIGNKEAIKVAPVVKKEKAVKTVAKKAVVKKAVKKKTVAKKK